MDRKQTGEHWDREEMARDTPGVPEDEQEGEVWNRRQMEFDNTGTPREGEGREALPPDPGAVPDPGTPDMEHISGRGMPSGESHWGRTDRGEPER